MNWISKILGNRKAGETILSRQGDKLSKNPSRIDMEIFLEASQNIFCPESNPDGTFLLNVAENNVANSIILNKIENIIQQNRPPEWILKYTDPAGHPEVRQTIAKFMTNFFNSKGFSSETLVFSAGASASLELSAFCLADPGEIVVIPAPAYPMYTNDLGLKSGLSRYDLQSHLEIIDLKTLAILNIEVLERIKKEMEDSSKRFKVLLLTTPDNPSGSCYTIDQLMRIANWCELNKIHLIVNEIYALSRFGKTGGNFQSIASIMHEKSSDYLHMIYALSKDFSASGLRFGIIHSHNTSFIKALSNANIPHMVSNLTQWVVEQIFNDVEFIDEYVRKNRELLLKNYDLISGTFSALNIPFIPAKGGLFVWCDLSEYLDQKKLKTEMDLWMAIYQNTGVLLTPGHGFGHQKEGLFRVVFSGVPFDHLKIAMDKLCDYLNSIK